MNFDVSSTADLIYTASYAIVLYDIQRCGNVAAATIHQIDEKGKMLDGRPFDLAEFRRLALMTQAEETEPRSRVLAGDVLAVAPEFAALWRPAAPAKLAWRTADAGFDKIANRRRVKLWSLVFMLGKNGFRVYAVKGNERPDAKTKLYYAPFYNTTQESVCWGSSARSSKSDPVARLRDDAETWLASPFTHPGGNGGATVWEEAYCAAGRGTAQVHDDALTASNRKLQEAIDEESK
ncbi:MAG: hypothetical protein PHI35_09495 [Victivallaceae bacterium]|nr:hypothetical protein [Victivallaceae bacterium]